MESSAGELLYGGAAGGGKSHALRAWGVRYCMEYPGATIVLFRRKYRELEETHIKKIQQEVPTSVAQYHGGQHELIFPNGATFMFRFVEGDDEVRTYDTAEFDALLFDELTHFTEYQYTYLLSRCRSVKSWWPGRRVRAGATPLGIGHAWVKARWIDPKEAVPMHIWAAPASEGGMTRQFIPAKATDNADLMKTDPDYMEVLRALPPEEYRSKALGDWNIFTGQFFTRWRDDIHVVKPFTVPPDWDRFICVDYGFNAPYGAFWFARPPGTQTAWFYREHYGKGVKSTEQAYQAYRATDDASEKINAIVCDPSMFSRGNVKGERVAPISDDWVEAFRGTTNIIRGNNERVPGWQLMRSLIDWQELPNGGVLVPPQVFFMSNCTNAIRTIPQLIADDHNPEDVDTEGEDHAGDAIRYGLMHAFKGGGSGAGFRGLRIGPRGLRVKR